MPWMRARPAAGVAGGTGLALPAARRPGWAGMRRHGPADTGTIERGLCGNARSARKERRAATAPVMDTAALTASASSTGSVAAGVPPGCSAELEAEAEVIFLLHHEDVRAGAVRPAFDLGEVGRSG